MKRTPYISPVLTSTMTAGGYYTELHHSLAVCCKLLNDFFVINTKCIQLSLHATRREAGKNSIEIVLETWISIEGNSSESITTSFKEWLKRFGKKTMYLCVWEVLE